MLEVQTRRELRSVIDTWRREGQSVALVPTMGNLHAGHMALVEKACQTGDKVVVSLYVNPTQFGEGDDLSTYPSTPESDRQKLLDGGCDLLYSPTDEAMYPHGHDQAVMIAIPPSLTNILEGEFRPGHFAGVVAAVARLFNHVSPDYAVFGEKDYQQLTIIRRMVEDLGYPVGIIGVPTVREANGLAMSSRNNYLDRAQIKAASLLNRELNNIARELKEPGVSYAQLEDDARAQLNAAGFKTDYVAIRRADDLGLPISNDQDNDQSFRILVAAWCGKTRLIDNIFVG
jgi:pantoate--beta-alanine ligase